MSKGVNKVTLIGNLGSDPDIRATQGGSQVVNISLATSETWKDKQTGQKQEKTEWHKVVFFGKLAEIAGQYLKKGSQIYIEGSLRTEKWQDKEGRDQYTTKVIANDLTLLGSARGDSNKLESTGSVAKDNGASVVDLEDDGIPF